MIALDGIAAYKIAKSAHIRDHFACLHMNLPRTPKHIMNLMHKFFAVAKKETIADLKSLKRNGEKFSATLDEWTSGSNRRYLNVNVHTSSGRAINLGLIRVTGSCPAEELERLFGKKLNEFELTKEDIIGCTSDGARVMQRFGRMLWCTHQECLNHGLHLGVIDIIVRKVENLPVYVEVSNESDSDSDDDSAYNDDNGDSSDDNDNGDISDDDDNRDISDDECVPVSVYELRPQIHSALQKVRKIIILFKNSPVKNSVLQEHVKKQLNKELKLLLDCRTRWNSTDTMLQRFLLLYPSSKAALLELNLGHYQIDDDIELLENLLQCLRPIKMAVIELSKRDCDLLKCEGK